MKLMRVVWVFFLLTVGSYGEASRVVYPKMLESRTANGGKVLKISEDLTLNLEKSSVFPREFFVYTTLENTPITYHMLGAEAEKFLYHDTEKFATLHVSDDEGLEIEGILGDTLRIKPAESEPRSIDGHRAHILYHAEQPESSEPSHKDYGTPFDNQTMLEFESRNSGSGDNRLPNKIYPEVHVVVDYHISMALKFSIPKIVKYMAIMTHSANLRYASMVQPEVKLKLVGITITKRIEDEPYMVPVKGYESTRNILYGQTIKNFNEYVKKQTYYSGSDIIFLLTGRNMSEWNGNTLNSWVGGYAYIGAACTQWKVGMSEERVGSYYGVYTYAHELAHSLGCAHDGDRPENWPSGHIGSQDCPYDDGYMMSYKFVKPHMYSFSKCCQREVLNLINRPDYRCLLEKNSLETGASSSRLPGEVSSRDTYCKKVYYSYPDARVDRAHNMQDCIVRCYITKELDSMLISAVDGVKCSSGKYCILGECKKKPKKRRSK